MTAAEKGFAWFGAIATLVGGFFALLQYTHQIDYGKVDRTFKLMEIYNSEPYQVVQNKNLEAWKKENKNRLKVEAMPVKTEEEKAAHRIAYEKFIIDVVDRQGLHNSIIKMLGFYQTLAVCVDQEACSLPTAKALFLKDITAFVLLYDPYIQKLKKEYDPKILEEIQEFVIKAYEAN